MVLDLLVNDAVEISTAEDEPPEIPAISSFGCTLDDGSRHRDPRDSGIQLTTEASERVVAQGSRTRSSTDEQRVAILL